MHFGCSFFISLDGGYLSGDLLFFWWRSVYWVLYWRLYLWRSVQWVPFSSVFCCRFLMTVYTVCLSGVFMVVYIYSGCVFGCGVIWYWNFNVRLNKKKTVLRRDKRQHNSYTHTGTNPPYIQTPQHTHTHCKREDKHISCHNEATTQNFTCRPVHQSIYYFSIHDCYRQQDSDHNIYNL